MALLKNDRESREAFYKTQLTLGWVKPESGSWLQRKLRTLLRIAARGTR